MARMAEWRNGGMAYRMAYGMAGMAVGMVEWQNGRTAGMAEWKETWRNECEGNRAKGNRTNRIKGI